MQNFGKICHFKGANKTIQKQVKMKLLPVTTPKNYVRHSTGEHTTLF